MKTQMTDANGVTRNIWSDHGGTRIVIVLLMAFAAGVLGGAYAHYRYLTRQAIEAALPAPGLSESTLAVLQRLAAPVELRFYAPSTYGGLPETTTAFAARVQELLSQYERAGGDKIRLTVSDPAADATAKVAAGAEGLLPFADPDGGVFYLGITIAQQGRKETIARLSPEWESALESDLSRAISRVTAATATPVSPAAEVSAVSATVDPALNEELVRSIPDFETRSFDDAAKILREASLVEFTAAVREMQSKVQAAQSQLAATADANPQADQAAAMKQLQQVQAEETEKLKQITAQLQMRIAALERLKGVNRSARR